MRKHPKVLFLTLKIFSAAGGIEKVCKIAGKALYEMEEEKNGLHIYSLYDKMGDVDAKYFPTAVFKGFAVNKVRFSTDSIRKGIGADIVLLSHINLLIIGSIIKLISPKTKLVLFTHGIEVWDELPQWKKKLLNGCNLLLAVSNYTKQKLLQVQKVQDNRCIVLNNCLDPFLAKPQTNGKNENLLQQYNLHKDDTVLLTLSRLSAHDRHKGYEKVLRAMNELKVEFPQLKYLIVGKYADEEKKWLDGLVTSFNLTGSVIITGYIPDTALADHFHLADMYVMPSTKEGFGIIFIEAMYYGLPVIAGNKDGSVDALAGGKLGILVDPSNQQQITEAIKTILADKKAFIPEPANLMKLFSYPVYKANLKTLLSNAGG